MRIHHRAILTAAGAAWLFGVGAGARALWTYAVTPGAPAEPAQNWPSFSQLGRQPDKFTLVMAAHPHCPCTRASVEALGRIMSRAPGRVAAYVLVLRPREFPDGWERTDIWLSAQRIAGVTVLSDEDGREASLFGARTSGQTALYDPGGRLVFSGGLTFARGHAGLSAAQNRVAALATGAVDSGAPASGPVFGCALGNEPTPVRE